MNDDVFSKSKDWSIELAEAEMDNRLELEYDLEQEDQLLSAINNLADPSMTQTFKLAPAYILTMSLEYSIKHYGVESTMFFTDKIYQMLKNNNQVRTNSCLIHFYIQ